MWKEAPARHKITRTPPCVLRENVPSFDRSIDTTLLESTCEKVGQDLVSKLWFSAPAPNRTAPHRTAPHRTVPNRTYSGSLVVRSWFALGSLVVLLRYSTVTVRYFNFFLTGTVHVYVYHSYHLPPSLPPSLPPFPPTSLPPSPSLTHSPSLSPSFPPSLSLSLTLPLSLPPSLPFPPPLSLPLPHSLTHSLPPSPSLPLPLSLTLPPSPPSPPLPQMQATLGRFRGFGKLFKGGKKGYPKVDYGPSEHRSYPQQSGEPSEAGSDDDAESLYDEVSDCLALCLSLTPV